MSTATIELLDSLARWYGRDSIASDYRLAREYFRITASKVSRWRTGRETFGDDRVVQICEDIWPGNDAEKARWLLRIHADREQNVHVREVWERLAKSVAMVAIVAGLSGAPGPAQAGFNADGLCIMRNRRRGPSRAHRHENTKQISAAA